MSLDIKLMAGPNVEINNTNSSFCSDFSFTEKLRNIFQNYVSNVMKNIFIRFQDSNVVLSLTLNRNVSRKALKNLLEKSLTK